MSRKVARPRSAVDASEIRRYLEYIISETSDPKGWEKSEGAGFYEARRGDVILGITTAAPGAPLVAYCGVKSGMPHPLMLNAQGDDPVSVLAFVQAAAAVLGQDELFRPFAALGPVAVRSPKLLTPAGPKAEA